jgi:hypothetical protein
MGIGEKLEAEGIENIFNKIVTEKFPNLKEEKVSQIQVGFWTPNRKDQEKKISPIHIMVKILIM